MSDNYDSIRKTYGLDFQKDYNGSPNMGDAGVANDDGAIFLGGDYLGHVKGYERNQKEGLDNDDLSGIKNLSTLKDGFTGSTFNTLNDAAGMINKLHEADKGPYEKTEKSERHQELEDEYGDGKFPSYEGYSAMDSYNTAFDNATAAGHKMTAGDLLRTSADAKRGWLTEEFMPYMSNKNELARHEMHHASSNAIERMAHAGIKLPELSDPKESLEDYSDLIDDVG